MRFSFFVPRAVCIVLTGLLAGPGVLHASVEPGNLAPNTKVEIKIVHWNPAQAEYQRWDALGGTFVVSPNRTVSLPILGSVNVSGRSSADLAGEIASSLQTKIGLLSPPEVTVEVVEYPPIYVVGLVSQPGQYPYQPGMTVLQALAVAGGRYRTDKPGGNDTLTLTGELEIIRAEKLRQLGRIARLDAEFGGADAIMFPPAFRTDPNKALVEDIIQLETLVFETSRKEKQRQVASLSELRDLYDEELSTLRAWAEAGDLSIRLAQKQLDGVNELFQKGVTTLARQADLERAVSELRADRLGVDTEMMRVLQSKGENKRNELSLVDRRQTNIAVELRDARAEFDRLRSREFTIESLLMEASGGAVNVETSDAAALVFEIVRNEPDGPVRYVATEDDLLQPADVLKVDPEGRPSLSEPNLSLSFPSTGDSSSGRTRPRVVPIPKPRPPLSGST